MGLAAALLVRRWYPERKIVAVADRTCASLKLLDRCRKLRSPITFITRLRLDAALYEPASHLATPVRWEGPASRARLPNLSIVAEDPATEWTPRSWWPTATANKSVPWKWFLLPPSGTVRDYPPYPPALGDDPRP
jgi:hypothetical protein